MARTVIDDFILEKYHARSAITDAWRTIELAEYRCIPVDRLIERVVGLVSERQYSEIILAIEESNLTDVQSNSLVIALQRLMQNVDSARGIDKGRFDRCIKRLLCVLPTELSQPIALDCISHRRKSRRTAGFRCLSVDCINEETYQYLVRRFEETGDKRILKALLSQPLRLSCIEPARMMASFEDDEYWQMRVVEAALRADRSVGIAYSATHPHAFVWAAGRLSDINLLPAVSRCLKEADKRWRLVGIVAWAYGKFQALDELRALHSVLEDLERQYDAKPE